MAAKKKTRGKSQLGKGRHSEREVARQQKSYDRRLFRAAVEDRDLDKVKRGWALEKGGEFKHSRDPGDKAWRKEQKAKSGPTTRWSKARIAAANAARASGDASNTPGEKAAPRGGGRAKAAATRARNIAASKKAGTYSGGKGGKKKQTLKNRLASAKAAAKRVPLAAAYGARGGGGRGGTK